MPKMKPHTMIWSLRESRWKHMVTTSFSPAPLQMGRDCDRQKARLHWLHEGEEVCARRWPAWERGMRSGSVVVGSCSSTLSRRVVSFWSADARGSAGGFDAAGSESVLASVGGSTRCEEEEVLLDLDLISIIVLLVKQVHLQKVGAALGASISIERVR